MGAAAFRMMRERLAAEEAAKSESTASVDDNKEVIEVKEKVVAPRKSRRRSKAADK